MNATIANPNPLQSGYSGSCL